MVNYSNSKVYKIISAQTDKIYIGSTTKKYLSQRIDKHRYQMKFYESGKGKKYTSFDILSYGDAQIILLEAFPNCTSVDELRSKEQMYIDRFRDVCVNKCNAVGLNKEKRKVTTKAYNDVYKVANAAKIKIYKNTKHACKCGGNFTNRNKYIHIKTNKHLTGLHKWLDVAYKAI
jgi:hypothetical protein